MAGQLPTTQGCAPHTSVVLCLVFPHNLVRMPRPGLLLGYAEVAPGYANVTPRLLPGYTELTPKLHPGYTRRTPGYALVMPSIHPMHTRVIPGGGCLLGIDGEQPWCSRKRTKRQLLPRISGRTVSKSVSKAGNSRSRDNVHWCQQAS